VPGLLVYSEGLPCRHHQADHRGGQSRVGSQRVAGARADGSLFLSSQTSHRLARTSLSRKHPLPSPDHDVLAFCSVVYGWSAFRPGIPVIERQRVTLLRLFHRGAAGRPQRHHPRSAARAGYDLLSAASYYRTSRRLAQRCRLLVRSYQLRVRI
jgi:hypothetical protein